MANERLKVQLARGGEADHGRPRRLVTEEVTEINLHATPSALTTMR